EKREGNQPVLKEHRVVPLGYPEQLSFGPNGRTLRVSVFDGAWIIDTALGRPLAHRPRKPQVGSWMFSQDGAAVLALQHVWEETDQVTLNLVVERQKPTPGFTYSVAGRAVAPAVVALAPDLKATLAAGRSPDDPTQPGPLSLWEPKRPQDPGAYE